MERFAIFVDAGYLLAAGGWVTVGAQRRVELDADCVGLVGMLQSRSEALLAGKELLRLYWYDAALARQPTPEQLRVADLPDCKIRIGQLTSRGDQKGVDAMVLSDLTTLARGRQVTDAILVSGDGDFVEAVGEAQREGVRVQVWAVSTPQSTLSPDLRREADRVYMFEASELSEFFSRRELPPDVVPSATTGRPEADRPTTAGTLSTPVWASLDPEDARTVGRRFADQWAGLASHGEVAAALASRPVVPPPVHMRLLRAALEEIGQPWGTRIPYDAAEALRESFWETLADAASRMSSA